MVFTNRLPEKNESKVNGPNPSKPSFTGGSSMDKPWGGGFKLMLPGMSN
jgi:hypothetical protein